jgi:hypothetical protein
MMQKRVFHKRLAEELAGLLIGIQILFKAIDKWPYFSHYPVHVSLLLLAGLFVTLGSLFHHLLEKRVKHVHALFHLIEGLVFMVIALLLFEKGKFRLPAFLFFIGFFYMILGVIGYRINKENYQRLGKLLVTWMGIAFFTFGLVAVVWNWNYDKDPWVFSVAALMVIVGFLYLLFTDWILKKMKKPETSTTDHSHSVQS